MNGIWISCKVLSSKWNKIKAEERGWYDANLGCMKEKWHEIRYGFWVRNLLGYSRVGLIGSGDEELEKFHIGVSRCWLNCCSSSLIWKEVFLLSLFELMSLNQWWLRWKNGVVLKFTEKKTSLTELKEWCHETGWRLGMIRNWRLEFMKLSCRGVEINSLKQ